MESITGKVLRTFPQDTNTDEIISGKYKYDALDLNKLAVLRQKADMSER